MYDVFISFKNLGEDGLPTRDSVLAKEIFDKLSGLGLDVFFSLVTLEKLGVSAYKYAIDKALDSASILVAVGTSRENLDSQWVRYEWDSFFNDIISGIKPEGRLFTCIEGCAVKSLPRVLRQSQVFDRSKGGIDKLINFISNSISIKHKEGGKDDEIDGKRSMTSTNERKTLSKVENVDRDMPVHSPVQTDSTNECEWIGSKMIRYHGEEKEVTIPSRASVLFSNAFKDNKEIERIIIPSSVSTIDFDAFENCPKLNQVVIEGRYVKIGDGSLPVSSRCDKLTFQCHRNSLTHKELVKAFSGPVVYFPGEEFEIEHGVLQKYFGNSKEVQLPAAVQIIGGFSFDKCLNLESLVMNDECGAILDNAFIYCPQLRNITLGKSFSSLAEGALRHIPYVKFSYYKHSMPKNLDQLFPDKSILSEISEAYKVTT